MALFMVSVVSGPEDHRGAQHPHRGEATPPSRARVPARQVQGPDGRSGGTEAELSASGDYCNMLDFWSAPFLKALLPFNDFFGSVRDCKPLVLLSSPNQKIQPPIVSLL